MVLVGPSAGAGARPALRERRLHRHPRALAAWAPWEAVGPDENLKDNVRGHRSSKFEDMRPSYQLPPLILCDTSEEVLKRRSVFAMQPRNSSPEVIRKRRFGLWDGEMCISSFWELANQQRIVIFPATSSDMSEL